MDYTLGDYGYLVEDDHNEFFDESHVVTDNDVFKPGFLDEEDDEFFKTLDDERENNYEEYERRHQVEVISNTKMPGNVIRIELNPDGSVRRISNEKK